MAEKELVIREEVEHSGIMDFPGTYSYANSWFRDEKYGVDEERYSEKVSGNSRDIAIRWRAIRKMSDYFKIEIEVRFEIRGLSDVEVEIDGSKKKMNEGNIKLTIKGALVKDHESKWDIHPFYRFMRDVYNKYIIPSRVEDLRDKVTDDAQHFKEEVKAFLELTGRRTVPR